jgi:hypothetical protein
VGALSDDGSRVRFANGEQRAPAKYRPIPNAALAEYEFADQRDKMWKFVYELDEVNRRCLARAHWGLQVGSLEYEELLADVGVKCLCKVALLYDPAKCGDNLRAYATKCLKRAYMKALQQKRGAAKKRRETQQDESLSQLPCEAQRKTLDGLADKQQLQDIMDKAGLSAGETELLFSYFDERISLRELAQTLSVASPTSAMNILNRIMHRCRHATQQR